MKCIFISFDTASKSHKPATQSQEKYKPTKDDKDAIISRVKTTGLFMAFILAFLLGTYKAMIASTTLSQLWLTSTGVAVIVALLVRMTYCTFSDLHCLSNNYTKPQYDDIVYHAENAFTNIFITFRSAAVGVWLSLSVGMVFALSSWIPTQQMFLYCGMGGLVLFGIIKALPSKRHVHNDVNMIWCDVLYILSATALLLAIYPTSG